MRKDSSDFPALTPGLYDDRADDAWICDLDVERHSRDHRRCDQPQLCAVREARYDAAQVTAARDAGNPGLGAHFGPTQLLETPTPRNGMFAFIVLSPFISQTSRTTSFVSAAGGGVDQNSYYVDGTNVTAASNSVARTEPGIDFAQDIRVQLHGRPRSTATCRAP